MKKDKALKFKKKITALKTGEVGQLPCSEGRMSRMVSQLGSKHAFGSGDEKPKELNKLLWFVFEMRVHTLQLPSGDIGLGRLPSLTGL